MRKTILLLALSLGMGIAHGRQAADKQPNPVANPAAIVEQGNMRFTVLTPQMIRIQYSPTRTFEDRATFAVINRRLPVPAFKAKTKGDYLYITTRDLTLRYRVGAVPTPDPSGGDNLRITFRMNGSDVEWHPGKVDSLNLKGTTRTLDQCMGDSHRKYLENGILSRAGWAVIDESPATKRGDGSTTFAFDGTVDGIPWVAAPADPDAYDWYFLGYGHQYKQALADFTKVAGRIPMPPLYVLGYWYSKYQQYTQQDFIDIATEIEQHEIPIDVMIFDMDWHRSDHWTGWSWDYAKIPDPKGLIDWMHRHELKVALNLHPADGVNDYEDGFAQIRADMGLDGSATNVPWQLEDSTFYRTMFRNIIRLRESEGVDFWWLDWQQYLTSPYTPGLGETFWCNHVFYHDMLQHRPDRRPMIYHRWGGLGSHRYPIGFSGDTWPTFSTLAFEPYFTATASNVGFGYWGHDLGGHNHQETGDNDPELYLRWMQFGVFTPIFRTHASNHPELERRIWKYDNFRDLRETVRLRYALMPYIYTAAREAYDTGVSICRPLYYEWPEADEAYRYENEYLFGNDILVSPVVTAADADGTTPHQTWLPGGQWYDVCRGRLVEGGRVLADRYRLQEIPYFYRAGSVIANNPALRNLKHQPGEIVLLLVPGADGKGCLYEDDGDSEGYKQGICSTTTFVQRRTAKAVTLSIQPRVGAYPGQAAKRAYTVEVLGEPQRPQAVELNGKPLPAEAWGYDAAQQKVTVRTAALPCDGRHVLTVRRAAAGR